MGKRELVALLELSSLRLVSGSASQCLFPAVSWVGLQCVVVVFPDHTHLPFRIFELHLSLATDCQYIHKGFQLKQVDLSQHICNYI